jgi:hypothetical protein
MLASGCVLGGSRRSRRSSRSRRSTSSSKSGRNSSSSRAHLRQGVMQLPQTASYRAQIRACRQLGWEQIGLCEFGLLLLLASINIYSSANTTCSHPSPSLQNVLYWAICGVARCVGSRCCLPACLNGQPHNSSATLLLDALLMGPTAASAVSSCVSDTDYAAAAAAAAAAAGRTQVVPLRALRHSSSRCLSSASTPWGQLLRMSRQAAKWRGLTTAISACTYGEWLACVAANE